MRTAVLCGERDSAITGRFPPPSGRRDFFVRWRETVQSSIFMKEKSMFLWRDASYNKDRNL